MNKISRKIKNMLSQTLWNIEAVFTFLLMILGLFVEIPRLRIYILRRGYHLMEQWEILNESSKTSR